MRFWKAGHQQQRRRPDVSPPGGAPGPGDLARRVRAAAAAAVLRQGHGPVGRDRSRRRLVRLSLRRRGQADRAGASQLPDADRVRRLAASRRFRSCAGGRPSARGAAKPSSDGKVYYKYKNSDVGPRIWKDIVAAPVWIPPDGTPAKDLLTRKTLDRDVGAVTVVNTDVMGPGFQSAYGLVMAIHHRIGGGDNQIRTHGSVDYTSIARRYSHGCHRLVNSRAVRLFDFILRRRPFERLGNQVINVRKRFTVEDKEVRIPPRHARLLLRAQAADPRVGHARQHQGQGQGGPSRRSCRSPARSRRAIRGAGRAQRRRRAQRRGSAASLRALGPPSCPPAL